METTRHRSREAGAALVVAVMMLALMGVIGLASMNTVMRDRQVAGFQSRARTALYAGEAGVAWARGILRSPSAPDGNGPPVKDGEAGLIAWTPIFPTVASPQQLNTGATNDVPTFSVDPNAPVDAGGDPVAIRYLGSGEECEGYVMSSEEGSPKFKEAIWDVRVEGQSSAGATVTIQVTGTTCYAYSG
ncbi:MAG: pilus assembly PilX N-terminal domain-containing protein [Proteobacteria bacterium]|nr:pilus assembly PilX N-terminal domain-containing protein [Pseudomonadota bacterium]